LLRDGEKPDGPPRTRSPNQGENAVETQRRRSAPEAGAGSATRAAAMTPRPTLKTRSPRAPGGGSSTLRTRKRSRSTRRQTRGRRRSPGADRQSQVSRAPCLAKTSDGGHFALPYAGFGGEAIETPRPSQESNTLRTMDASWSLVS